MENFLWISPLTMFLAALLQCHVIYSFPVVITNKNDLNSVDNIELQLVILSQSCYSNDILLKQLKIVRSSFFIISFSLPLFMLCLKPIFSFFFNLRFRFLFAVTQRLQRCRPREIQGFYIWPLVLVFWRRRWKLRCSRRGEQMNEQKSWKNSDQCLD